MQSESAISVVEKGLVNAIRVNNFSVQQIEELLTFAKIVPAINQVTVEEAMGVPMIAFPLQSDQPVNAFLLVEEAKVAVEIKMIDHLRKREDVERAVRSIMAMDEAALQMKQRVKALSIAALWNNHFGISGFKVR